MPTLKTRDDQERSRAGRRTQRVPGRARPAWNAVTTLRNDTKAEYFYDYAGDDPINETDPNGMSACSKHGWMPSFICKPANSVSHYLKKHQWARCALFVAGVAVTGAEYYRVGKALYEAANGIRKFRAAEHLGRFARNVGTVGAGGTILSALTGGCIDGLP